MSRRGEADVVIVDDHELFAQALEIALTGAGVHAARLDLPHTALSTGPLLSRVLRHRPRVLLLDLDLAGHGDGLALVEPVSRGGTDVLVLTGTPDAGRWARAVLSGARRVIAKSSPLSVVVDAVDRLLKGLPVMSDDERRQLLAAWADQRTGSAELWVRFDRLTLRESEVLGLLMQGHQVRDVARRSGVAESTVRSQVKALLAKLEVTSQLAAVGLAYQVGWRPPFDLPLTS